jgi:replicative DNA helicase
MPQSSESPIIYLSDKETELKVLAGFLRYPKYWKSIPLSFFTDEVNRKCYQELERFQKPPYNTFASYETAIEKVADAEVKLRLTELSVMDINPVDTPVYLHTLFEMYARRQAQSVASSLASAIEKPDIFKSIREVLVNLTEINDPLEQGLVEREFVYESVKERWERYKLIESDPLALGRIPTKIKELDQYLNGGPRPSEILLFYGSTGAGKTRVKANIAYNMAVLDNKDVMVITLEVPRIDYETIFDSRHGLLNFSDITGGKLAERRQDYLDVLRNIRDSKPSLYIVDIPGRATSADIIRELQVYYMKTGKYPEVLVIDYVNELEPVTSWSNTSEKFKNLGVELRRIARSFKLLIVTSMQENREGMQMKNKEKSDLSNISESHYFSNVCSVIIHLYQDEVDMVSNQIHFSIKKNRHGRADVSFPVFFNPVFNYVGDRTLTTGEK